MHITSGRALHITKLLARGMALGCCVFPLVGIMLHSFKTVLLNPLFPDFEVGGYVMREDGLRGLVGSPSHSLIHFYIVRGISSCFTFGALVFATLAPLFPPSKTYVLTAIALIPASFLLAFIFPIYRTYVVSVVLTQALGLSTSLLLPISVSYLYLWRQGTLKGRLWRMVFFRDAPMVVVVVISVAFSVNMIFKLYSRLHHFHGLISVVVRNFLFPISLVACEFATKEISARLSNVPLDRKRSTSMFLVVSMGETMGRMLIMGLATSFVNTLSLSATTAVSDVIFRCLVLREATKTKMKFKILRPPVSQDTTASLEVCSTPPVSLKRDISLPSVSPPCVRPSTLPAFEPANAEVTPFSSAIGQPSRSSGVGCEFSGTSHDSASQKRCSMHPGHEGSYGELQQQSRDERDLCLYYLPADTIPSPLKVYWEVHSDEENKRKALEVYMPLLPFEVIVESAAIMFSAYFQYIVLHGFVWKSYVVAELLLLVLVQLFFELLSGTVVWEYGRKLGIDMDRHGCLPPLRDTTRISAILTTLAPPLWVCHFFLTHFLCYQREVERLSVTLFVCN